MFARETLHFHVFPVKCATLSSDAWLLCCFYLSIALARRNKFPSRSSSVVYSKSVIVAQTQQTQGAEIRQIVHFTANSVSNSNESQFQLFPFFIRFRPDWQPYPIYPFPHPTCTDRLRQPHLPWLRCVLVATPSTTATFQRENSRKIIIMMLIMFT